MTYYVMIENDKINGKGQCPCEGDGIQCIEVTEDVYNNLDQYIWNDDKLEKNPNYEQEHYEKLKEEARQNREDAYVAEVDKITNHILRLRDKEQTPEIIAEIEELINERDAKYEEVKARYPYPEELQ